MDSSTRAVALPGSSATIGLADDRWDRWVEKGRVHDRAAESRVLTTPAQHRTPTSAPDANAALNRVAILGNRLPRQCGIATFTSHLQSAVDEASPGIDCFVLAVNDPGMHYSYPEGNGVPVVATSFPGSARVRA